MMYEREKEQQKPKKKTKKSYDIQHMMFDNPLEQVYNLWLACLYHLVSLHCGESNIEKRKNTHRHTHTFIYLIGKNYM